MFSFFRKKNKESPVEEKKETEFKFSVLEACKIGDKYEYTVKANSRAEAFEKLVKWFYEVDSSIPMDDVKQEHFTVTYPHQDTFIVEHMPTWFGKKLSGIIRGEAAELAHFKFLQYCKKHNIKVNQ